MGKFIKKDKYKHEEQSESGLKEQRGPLKRGSGRIKLDLLIHDLKGPLSVIEAGAISLLKRAEKYGPLTDKQERVLARIIRNTKTTQTLVSDALELGRSREGKVFPTRFQLSDLIIQTLTEVFDLAHSSISEKIKACGDLKELKNILEQEGLELSVGPENWSKEVLLDEAKIKQILRNLLNNALKYRKNRIDLALDLESNFLIISVNDDGEGIPAVYHEKIFECYFQLPVGDTCSVRGHGLGLAGVMILVEDLGGELTLDSDSGSGATFKVKIPMMG